MSKIPLVSVIIVNYNGKGFIKECIDSVLESNYLNFEVIVVDNASTDGSYEYLKKLYEKKRRVKIISSNKQLYFTGGNNLGARSSKGEKLIFLNSDTVVGKNWMKELVAFENGRRKYLVQPKILSYWEKDVIDNVGGKYNFLGFGYGMSHGERDMGQYNKNSLVDYANGTVFMIDRKFFMELGGFDEWYKLHYEDIDLNLRAKKHGGKSWYCYKSIVYHKESLTIKNKNNITKEKLLFNIRKNRLRTVVKNFSGVERFLKVAGVLIVYIGLIIRNLAIFRWQRALLTIKSVVYNINK